MTVLFARRAIALLLLALLALVLGSMAWPVFAAAGTDAAPIDEPLISIVRIIYDGVMSGQYFAAAAGALVLVTALARRYGAPLVPWLATDAGGTVLVLSGSFGGALLTAALGGASASPSLAWTAATVAFFAAGGYAALKRLVIEPLRPRAVSWPSWARALYRLVAWIFDRPQTTSSRASTAPIVGVVLLVTSVAIVGCTAHQREVARAGAGAGANTALVCQTESLHGLAFEAYELARHYVVSLVSGAGEVDTAALRIAARQVRTDAGRCAFAAALAAVTEAMAQRRGVLGVGPEPSYVLRRELEIIARDDWQRQLSIDGELVQ